MKKPSAFQTLFTAAAASVCSLSQAVAETTPLPSEAAWAPILSSTIGSDRIVVVPGSSSYDQQAEQVETFIQNRNLTPVPEMPVSGILAVGGRARRITMNDGQQYCFAIGIAEEDSFHDALAEGLTRYGIAMPSPERVSDAFWQVFALTHETVHCTDLVELESHGQFLRRHFGSRQNYDSEYIANFKEAVADVATAIVLVNASRNPAETLNHLRGIADFRVYELGLQHNTSRSLSAVLDQLEQNPARYRDMPYRTIVETARDIAVNSYVHPSVFDNEAYGSGLFVLQMLMMSGQPGRDWPSRESVTANMPRYRNVICEPHILETHRQYAALAERAGTPLPNFKRPGHFCPNLR